MTRAAARPGEVSREQRMRRMVRQVLTANGLDPSASIKRMRLVRMLSDRLLDAEDQREAIARGEQQRPSAVARVEREIRKITASLDRMRDWEQKQANWRADDDARKAARAPAHSVRIARIGAAVRHPSGCPSPTTTDHEGEAT